MSKNTRNRILLTALAALLLVTLTIGGTMAWLNDKSDTITNTFSTSHVDITLDETTGTTYKMIPGKTITKNPKVTVKANSEACWVFVKIEKSTDVNFDDYMTYEMGAGWIALEGESGVYYREQAATTDDVPYPVIKDNTLTVKDTVTNAMMTAAEAEGKAPQLIITAYAVQKEAADSASAAWAIAEALTDADKYVVTTTQTPADGE